MFNDDLEPVNTLHDDLEPVTPTGLATLNSPPKTPTPGAPTLADGLIDMAAKASPVLDLANTVSKNPKARHFINDVTLQGAGEYAGNALLPGVGGTVGAGVGNAAAKVVNDIEDDPELAKRAMTYIFADPERKQLLTDLLGKDPDKAAQYVRGLGIPLLQRFTTGAIFQLIGKGVSSAIGATADALKGSAMDVGSKILPDAEADAGFARMAGSKFVGPTETGVKLNPDQITSSKVADAVDKIARRGIFSGDKMRAFDAANKEALKATQNSLTSTLSGDLTEHIPRSELADYITSTNEVGQKIQKSVSDHLYSKADEALGGQLVPIAEKAPTGIIDPSTGKEIMGETGNTVYKRVGGITVPTAQVKDLAQLELTKSELINGIGNAEKLGGLLSKIKTLDAGVNFSDMKNLRSEILDLNRDATTSGAKRILSQFAGKINEVMQDTAGQMNPEGYQAWRNANDFYREGVQTFQDDAVAKIITNDHRMADNLGNAIYQNGNVKQIQQLKKIAARVDDLVNNSKYADQLKEVIDANPRLEGTLQKGELTYDAIMNKYKRGYLQEMFNAYAPKNVDPSKLGGVPLNFAGLVGELEHPEAIQTMKELFKPEEISKLKQFARVGGLAMKRASDAVPHGGFTFPDVFEVIQKMTGLDPGMLASRLLTNPKSSELFLNGVSKFAENGVQATKVGANLITQSALALMERRSEGDN